MRTAILVGVAVPLAMFLSWDAAVLGNMAAGADAGAAAAAGARPLGPASPARFVSPTGATPPCVTIQPS